MVITVLLKLVLPAAVTTVCAVPLRAKLDAPVTRAEFLRIFILWSFLYLLL